MAKIEEIRKAAERVASSFGLEIVDVELFGPAKERTLRVLLERNAAGRARFRDELAAQVAAGATEEIPERLAEGKVNVDQLSCVTHEDCTNFARDFGVLLDVEDLVGGGEYVLEASSPGLDRKLSKPEEFQRFTGSLVKMQTLEPIRNNRQWFGRMTAAETGVVLDLTAVKQNSKSRKAGVSTVEIPYAQIEKAQLVPEF